MKFIVTWEVVVMIEAESEDEAMEKGRIEKPIAPEGRIMGSEVVEVINENNEGFPVEE